MTYPLDQIALVALIMAFGSIVQGAVGFGSGLLGVPLLVLSGFSIPEAATINLTSTAVQNIAGAWKLRSQLVRSELVLPVTFRLLAIPFGTYAAYLVDQHFDLAQSKQLVGMLLLATVALLWGLKVAPRESLNVGWQALAFSSSGFLMGFAAMGGAPMVIYVNALNWTAHKSRALLFFCSAIALPVVTTSFWWEHGKKILPAATAAILVLPLILLGLKLGLALGHRLSKTLFRRITYALIVVVAVVSILAPLF